MNLKEEQNQMKLPKIRLFWKTKKMVLSQDQISQPFTNIKSPQKKHKDFRNKLNLLFGGYVIIVSKESFLYNKDLTAWNVITLLYAKNVTT